MATKSTTKKETTKKSTQKTTKTTKPKESVKQDPKKEVAKIEVEALKESKVTKDETLQALHVIDEFEKKNQEYMANKDELAYGSKKFKKSVVCVIVLFCIIWLIAIAYDILG